MFKTVTINSKASLDDNVLLMSSDLANSLGMQELMTIKLCVGQKQKTLTFKVNSTEKNRNTVLISAHNTKLCYLQSGRKYGISKQGVELRIGPVVGIMAEPSGDNSKPFGGQSLFIKQLITCGSSLGEICFAFSPFGINWRTGNVSGYTFSSRGWIKGNFPIPDIIYPRGRAYSAVKMGIRKRLETMGVKYLNPGLVGKWQTHRIITQNPALLSYIPDTRLVNNFNQVDKMIKKYQAVYLKPVTGSQGKNIVKVVKHKKSSTYQYQYQMNNRLISGSAPNLAKLRACLKPVMGNRTYIIQKQINLLQSEGNIIDVRILVQKDHTGSWDVTGIACRVGRQGSITSNISAGGSARKLDVTLKNKFSDEEQRQDITAKIKFVAIEAARTLEQSIGPSGEMGVDIGIDKAGRIWFIEANLRPARQVFTLIGEKKTRQQSVEKPMLYSRYLAGF